MIQRNKRALVFLLFLISFALPTSDSKCAEKEESGRRINFHITSRKKRSSAEQKKLEEENYARGVFEGDKMDIYNRYIEDIKYDIIPTAKSIIAIGEKLVSEDMTEDVDGDEIESIVEEVMSEKKEESKPKDDLVVKKIHSSSMILMPLHFEHLDGWKKDNHDHALESFLNSCKVMVTYIKRGRQIKNEEIQFGNIKDWYDTCLDAVKYGRAQESRKFFEENFVPFLVYDKKNNTPAGRFTGYNEFSIKGSMHRTPRYKYAIYLKPKTCKSGATCPTRRQINNGALNGMGLEICWVDNPMDLYRMQIQGSGIVLLNNYQFLRLSFSDTNHHRKADIWSHLDVKKILPPERRTHSRVNKWLHDNPKFAEKLLNHNPSYSFFVPNNRRYALGSGSTLTPSRSIAIDPRYIPYGMPMWIETKLPVKDASKKEGRWINLHRLTIAQDTGQAIKGVIRADIFFGHGDKASYLAHHTKFDGSYYMLIPRRAIPNIRGVSNDKTTNSQK